MRNIALSFFLCFTISCSSTVNLASNSEVEDEMPGCLKKKIKIMSQDLYEGMPQSVTQYTYRGQKVFYLVAPCCDKFNVVYDSVCTILGYPDGGITGRGDGKMADFDKEATNGKVIWEANNEQVKSPASTKKQASE